MLRKLAIAAGVVIGVIALFAVGAWGYIQYMERQMDPGPLVERLEATPIPSDNFVLTYEGYEPGQWLFGSREPEATGLYLTPGTVDDTCVLLDNFYGALGMEIRSTSRSDDPTDWCGRSLYTDRGVVSIWVEPANDWRTLPEELEGIEPLTEVHFAAYRR